jgi:predicted DCC family thiol-disulfide oxidoreductase YuxK/nicotinamide riboside kinase
MFRIAITGPESSGKSALAKQLSTIFGCDWVAEYARMYLERLDRPYELEDLLHIAKGQLNEELAAEQRNPGMLILDTSLEVIKIWSEFKYGTCDSFINDNLLLRKHNLYLLCRHDLPWEYDPQRENSNDRQELFELYKSLLIEMRVPFAEVFGLEEERTDVALKAVLNHFPASQFLLPEWRSIPIVFFDGVCNFCNSTVQWVLKRDYKGTFRFAPIQSDAARLLLAGNPVNFEYPESVLLLCNDKLYNKTEAVIELLKQLGGVFQLAAMALRIVPAFIRNPVYNWIARNRYQLFGRKNECMVPGKEEKSRFL